MPPGHIAQSVGHLTRKSGVLGSILVSPSAFSRRAVVSYWRKYVHEVLVNRLGSLSLPRKSVVWLTDRPDMTLDVYRGRKTTIQQQQLSTASVQSNCREPLFILMSMMWHGSLLFLESKLHYRISSVIRQGFFLPKQSKSSRSIL